VAIKIFTSEKLYYPGLYDQITDWLRTYLRVEAGATDPVIARLDELARLAETGAYPSWPKAVEAAQADLGQDAGTMPVNPESLAEMVRRATYIVQDTMRLTGANSQPSINELENGIEASADRLLAAARTMPPSHRAVVRAADMQELLTSTGSQSVLAPWQAVIVHELVQHPILVVKRPRILLAGTQQLHQSHITKLKPTGRISGTCEFDGSVGGYPVRAVFGTNSGNNPTLFEYDRPHPTQRDVVYQAKEHITVDQVYKAFDVTADERERDATPRNLDAEKKLFDAVHDLLVRTCLHLDARMDLVTGTLTMTTEIRMCTSCYLVALQFLTNFPTVEVRVNKL
jgi:hypothetical protein